MPIVRKTLLIAISVLAVLFLIAAAIDIGVVKVIGSPEPIKKTLADSGIYDSIIPSTLDQIESDQLQPAAAGYIPFDSQLVKTAAIKTFDGAYIQKTSDSIIDSIFRWLDGQSSEPDFKINLAAKKAEFAKQVAAAVKKRIDSLPVCTKLSSASFNAFNAKCRPASVTSAEASAVVRKDILNNSEFLNDKAITAADIKSGGSNQPFFSGQLKNAPAAYQRFKASPLVLFIIAAMALIGVFFLSQNKVKGLKHVGFILAGCGIFVLLLALAVDQAVHNKLISQINIDNTVLQHDLRQLAGDIAKRTTNTLLAFGTGYLILGVAGLGGYYFIRRKNEPAAPKKTRR
ncbi:MAG TPA: hypothetical protein VFW52_03605 [Candidatus Saccharimonadales bacterium]|nr:hypothetical protein [Candidatus Saccharimonadales bacterium]